MAYLQPLVAIRSGETAGLEALVRWQHPELGLLTSSSFLDLAEPLDRVVSANTFSKTWLMPGWRT